MWIAIFAQSFGHVVWTIGYIIIHTRHLCWYMKPFPSHPKLLLLYISFVKPLRASMHHFFNCYLCDLNHVTSFEPYNDASV